VTATKKRRGGKPTYTPETAARRADGRVTLGLSPEDAAALRRRGAEHPGGMAGVVAEWLRRAGDK
jgi:alkanesulfonate monooxygenase SsuD/methylene tetrahydromethanopterin reductase-like flavin-dependent oxidoreductase (luciferase family)